jgi:branched-chain amino acid transport system substrate-binding protein
VTEPPDVPDRAPAGKESRGITRRFPVGLLAVVVTVSTVVIGYGLIRIISGKAGPAFTLQPSPLPERLPGRAPSSCPDTRFRCVSVGPGEPIKIGTIFIAGDDTGLGSDSRNGVLLAMQLRDTPGEIAGHAVEFVHHDDGCSAEGGKAGATALADDPQIAGVIGPNCSSAALGVADTILSEAGIVLISPSNTGPALTDPPTHQPFYLRTAWNDKLQGIVAARFAFEETGARSASTIHDGSPWADDLQLVFANEFTSLGGTIVKQEVVQVGTTDFRPLLTDIASDNIDYLYYPIFVAEGGLITAQAREIPGLSHTDLAGSDGMFTSDWIDAAGAENAEGVYISDPYLSPLDREFYEKEVLPAYEERFGGPPWTEFHAYAFDALNLLADAIDAVAIETVDGGLLIPRTALKDRLYATEGFEGITGVLSCNDNGDCQERATIAIHQVARGSFRKPIKTYTITLEEVGHPGEPSG